MASLVTVARGSRVAIHTIIFIHTLIILVERRRRRPPPQQAAHEFRRSSKRGKPLGPRLSHNIARRRRDLVAPRSHRGGEAHDLGRPSQRPRPRSARSARVAAGAVASKRQRSAALSSGSTLWASSEAAPVAWILSITPQRQRPPAGGRVACWRGGAGGGAGGGEGGAGASAATSVAKGRLASSSPSSAPNRSSTTRTEFIALRGSPGVSAKNDGRRARAPR